MGDVPRVTMGTVVAEDVQEAFRGRVAYHRAGGICRMATIEVDEEERNQGPVPETLRSRRENGR
jgi:hypothetical protein